MQLHTQHAAAAATAAAAAALSVSLLLIRCAAEPHTTPPMHVSAPAVELSDFTKELRYCCQTCPYVYKITRKVGMR